MKTKLSLRTVKAAEPGPKRRLLWDDDVTGFGLKVEPTGRKVFIYEYKFGGRTRRFTIGPAGRVAPEQARRKAKELAGQVAAGSDPAADKRASAHRGMTVSDLCDLFLEERRNAVADGQRSELTLSGDSGHIRRHIKPLIGKREVRNLTKNDVERMMRDIADGKTAVDEKTKKRGRARVTGGTGSANHARRILSSMLSLAVSRGVIERNPAAGTILFKRPPVGHYMTADEMKALGDALTSAEERGENPMALAAIRFLMLTGRRKGEVLKLRWDQVDLGRGLLTLRQTKTGPMVFHLPPAAKRLLADLPRLGKNPYVFWGAVNGQHLVAIQPIWDRVRRDAGLAHVRLHDLRHTVASVMAERGALPLVGAALGHKRTETTQRYAHFAADPVRDLVATAADEVARRAGMAKGRGDGEEEAA